MKPLSHVGQIVHYAFRERDASNIFAVVLTETTDDATLLRIRSERVSGDDDDGTERPQIPIVASCRPDGAREIWDAEKQIKGGEVAFVAFGAWVFRLWDGQAQPYRYL